MKTALMLLAVVACPASRTADGGSPTSAHEGVAAGASNVMIPAEDPGGEGPVGHEDPPPIAESFVIEARTQVWVVAGGSCVKLGFRARESSSGTVVIRGVRIDYVQQADQLELGPASRSEGEGLVSRPCRTQLRVGPGRTLGGATLFDDEAACVAGRTTAVALDDSAEATAARCRGEPTAVTTDEVECGVEGRYAVVAGHPGCIGVALAWP